jgi:N4-gp56 family major capsid protein
MPIVLDPRERLKYGREITVASASLSFFRSFIGPSDHSIIKSKLETEARGDKGMVSIVGLRAPLRGSGVEGNTDFSANEDNLQYLTQAVGFRVFGNSILSRVRSLDERWIASFRDEAKPALIDWAADMIDRRLIAALSKDATNIAACDASAGVKAANSTAAIAAGDILTTKTIDELVKRARNGLDGAGAPHPKVRPVLTKQGKNEAGIETYERVYVLLVGGYQAAQLRSDPVWIETQREANDRGRRNPLFTGEIGKYNGVVVVDWDTWSADSAGVVTSATSFTTLDGAYDFSAYAGASGRETEVGLFLGASAALLPQDDGFKYYEDSAQDSGRKTRIGVDRGIGFAKAHWVGETAEEKASVYHDKDYGVIAVVASKE